MDGPRVLARLGLESPIVWRFAMRYSRRDVLCQFGAAAGAAALSSRVLHGQAQTPAAPVARISPPSVVSNPPRDFGPGASPVTYPDPDIITIDPSFGTLRL